MNNALNPDWVPDFWDGINTNKPVWVGIDHAAGHEPFPTFTALSDCPLETGVTYMLAILPQIAGQHVALCAQRVLPELNMVMLTISSEERSASFCTTEKNAKKNYKKIQKKLWLKLAEKTYDEVTK